MCRCTQQSLAHSVWVPWLLFLPCLKTCRFGNFLVFLFSLHSHGGGEACLHNSFPAVLSAIMLRNKTYGLLDSVFSSGTSPLSAPLSASLPAFWSVDTVSLAQWQLSISLLSETHFPKVAVGFPSIYYSCGIKPAGRQTLLCRWLIVTLGFNKVGGRQEIMGVTRSLSAANASGCHLQVAKSTGSAVLRNLSGFVSQVIISFGNFCLINKIQMDFLLRNRKFILKNNSFTRWKLQWLSDFLPIKSPWYETTSACILGMQVAPRTFEINISCCAALDCTEICKILLYQFTGGLSQFCLRSSITSSPGIKLGHTALFLCFDTHHL